MLSAVLQATEMSCDLLLSANSNYWYWRVVSCGAAAYVVVPRQRWKVILHQLHEGHTGVSRMKGLTKKLNSWLKPVRNVKPVSQRLLWLLCNSYLVLHSYGLSRSNWGQVVFGAHRCQLEVDGGDLRAISIICQHNEKTLHSVFLSLESPNYCNGQWVLFCQWGLLVIFEG